MAHVIHINNNGTSNEVEENLLGKVDKASLIGYSINDGLFIIPFETILSITAEEDGGYIICTTTGGDTEMDDFVTTKDFNAWCEYYNVTIIR